jgi:hypothetical protein
MDLVCPSSVCQLLRRAYRLQRLQFQSFKALLRAHSLQDLISIITPYYQAFAENLNTLLSNNLIEFDFDAVLWSCKPLEKEFRERLVAWLRSAKSQNSDTIDALLFRTRVDSVNYEPRQEGLLFSGLHDGILSSENILDISLFMDTLEIEPVRVERVNGDTNDKRSAPGITPSWESVVQTSSNLFSALSFGTIPVKRSPLSVPLDSADKVPKDDLKLVELEGRWIVGGDSAGKKIWLEVSAGKSVPISLGNQRPGFMSSSGLLTPGELDNLVELELSVYQVLFCEQNLLTIVQ